MMDYFRISNERECMEFYIKCNLSFLAFTQKKKHVEENNEPWSNVIKHFFGVFFLWIIIDGRQYICYLYWYSKSDRKISNQQKKKKKQETNKKPQQHWVNDDNEPRIKSSFHHKSIIIDWHFANEQQTRLYFNRFFFVFFRLKPKTAYIHNVFGQKPIWFITFSKIITNLDKLVAFAFRLTTNDTSSSSSMALVDFFLQKLWNAKRISFSNYKYTKLR